MNKDAVIAVLRVEAEKVGGVRQWAENHGMSEETARLVLRGKRPPGQTVLNALGFRRVVSYEVMRG